MRDDGLFRALVRYRLNDYSVPTAYGFHDVLVKGFVDEFAIFCGAVEIARYPRSYSGEFVFEPRHYLALLEQKPGALDQAAPLRGWILPEPLQHLRRLLESRMGNRGKREFIQVLRLMEVFSETVVAAAALDAIRLDAIGFDAVKQLVIAKVERRPDRLDLCAYPFLPPRRQNDFGRRLYRSRLREGGMTATPSSTARRRRRCCSGIICASSNCRLSCANMKKSPRKPRAKVSIMSVSFCVWPSSNSSTAKGAWSSGVSAARGVGYFPAVKSFDTFDFTAIPSLNKPLILELARCEYVVARDNIIALGNSGTGKTHVCLGLGLAACQRGLSVAFFTAAGLAHQLMEARDERRLLKLQAQFAAVKLLIVDELGYVPLSQTGAELLFEIFSQRHERGSTIVTSNLPFEEWTSVFGNQRLTGARLDRRTHHVHILELNGEISLKQSKARRRPEPQHAEQRAIQTGQSIRRIQRNCRHAKGPGSGPFACRCRPAGLVLLRPCDTELLRR